MVHSTRQVGVGAVGDVLGVSMVKSWSGGKMLLEVLNESCVFLS